MIVKLFLFLKSRNLRIIAVNSLLSTLVIIILSSNGALELAELHFFDHLVQKRPERSIDPNIVLVGITESDIKYLNGWPVSDLKLTQILTNIKKQNPRVIGLNLYRDIPVMDGYDTLADFFRNTNNIIGVEYLDEFPHHIEPPVVLKEKKLVGISNFITDRDSSVRRYFLTVSVKSDDNNPKMSLAVMLAFRFLEEEDIQLKAVPNTKSSYQLGESIFHLFKENDGGYAQKKIYGSQILINYRGNSCEKVEQCKFPIVSVEDILEERIDSDFLENKVVILGPFASSLSDSHSTPYTNSNQNLFSGIEIHAHVTSQLIDAALKGDVLFRTWHEFSEWGWLFLWAILGSSFGLYATKRRLALLLFIPLSLSSYGITYWLFLENIWIPFVAPFSSFTLAIVSSTAFIGRLAGKIRNTFGRYLSDEIVETLLDKPGGLNLGGERRTITILTSDLRGFTSFSECHDPEEVIEVLNLYLGKMADVITRYSGTIDEFMGDGILVLFGAPIERDDDPERAIACAISMQQALDKVNEKIIAMNLRPLEMGIGINTGEVLVGNIGSKKRSKYGVVGNQVNLTYRIESYTLGGQILISENTYKSIKEQDQLMILGYEQVTPKGITKTLTIYEVGGIRGKYDLDLSQRIIPREVKVLRPIPKVIPINFYFVEGKDIEEQPHLAYIQKLSEHEAYLLLSNFELLLPEPFSNLKLNFFPANPHSIKGDIYAKVLKNESLIAPQFHISFTSLPQEIYGEFLKIIKCHI
ncbi:adenylate/guanylate cyclase with Chase sensor [[Leptolyngbya] sp. PCC 7376]|uniref:CHASE2 domain-containing protein n=1 Tax=[Leptolyngbya] sp. PCC 7376 TaxID=111781 RepID=UPI00029EEDBF|nr:adenylate/guanylate cyclase domain-containing protein [[Leptolyngbya] sp. PCC 7376]AFY39958.1 adenylate/guanylate cyclase with Chase sensor [[Leptolyngbya] sp. PCC 7376]